MKASEFNEIWHKIAEEVLLPKGFIRIGNSYITIQGTSVFQFSKSSQKSVFTGFMYGYTHTFFEKWPNEFPDKWPLNLEELCFVFSNKTLIKYSINDISSNIPLALEYSNGIRDRSEDFPLYDLNNVNAESITEYIRESVQLASDVGLSLCKELTAQKTAILLDGKVNDSFLPQAWLKKLRYAT